MSKQKPNPSSAPTHPHIDAFITNIRLLGFDKLEGWSSISVQAIRSKDAGPNQKLRIESAEWALYHLYRTWDPQEASDKLQPFFPPLVPLQSLNLRVALFRCLNELKTDGTLGKDVTLRKTMFDDCRGDKFIELMLVFSTLVLRKVVEAGEEGKGSVVNSWYTFDGRCPHQQSLLPLAIAHRADLKRLLQKKEELRGRYKSFGDVLDIKDREVDRKFNRIVEIQGFLDQNIAPEATVARLAKQFEQHWQGEQRYIKAITEGDDSIVTDAFLDQPFHGVWAQANKGTLQPDFTTNRRGLLQDFENRVAAQITRLQKLKDFKVEMQKNMRAPSNTASPMRRPDIASPLKGKAMEKDLVFSPRKRPRKSEFPIHAKADIPSRRSSISPRNASDNLLELQTHGETTISKSTGDFLDCGQPGLNAVFEDSPSSEKNDSGFSEVNNEDLTTRLSLHKSPSARESRELKSSSPEIDSSLQDRIARKRVDSDGFTIPNIKDVASSRQPSLRAGYMSKTSPKLWHNSHYKGHVSPQAWRDSLYKGPTCTSPNLQDDDLRAAEILSSIPNAAPTPLKQPLSLVERTRQSLAFASPSTRIRHDSPLKSQLPPHRRFSIAQATHPDPESLKLNLADRTRQSISLANTTHKPKLKRKSSLNRHDSRTYPVNQFETPCKPGLWGGKELTPPEELFSPGKGYDSVFKSRPKVGFSPTGTPTAELEDCGIGEVRMEGLEGLGSSPLARKVGMV